MKKEYDYINVVGKHAVIADVEEKKGIVFISVDVDFDAREDLCRIITRFMNNRDSL